MCAAQRNQPKKKKKKSKNLHKHKEISAFSHMSCPLFTLCPEEGVTSEDPSEQLLWNDHFVQDSKKDKKQSCKSH